MALGQDMTTSAMQLGKALNDPIKGVTALRQVGVRSRRRRRNRSRRWWSRATR